jgi:hypothetical protein
MPALQSVGCVDLCIILMTETLHDFRLDSSVLLDVYTYHSSSVHFFTQHNFMCSLNLLDS